MKPITESAIEQYTLDLLCDQGYAILPGSDLAPEEGAAPALFAGTGVAFPVVRRRSYETVLLEDRLKAAIERLNPQVSADAREQAFRAVKDIFSTELLTANREFHRLLTEGVNVISYRDGQERGDQVWLVDFATPENNEFLAVNQFTVVEKQRNKRMDVALFVNGLPLVIFELKNAVDDKADIRKAYDQVQTYKATVPSLFFYNELVVVSDGLEAKVGTIASGLSRFLAWKSADGRVEASGRISQLKTLIEGMLNKPTLLNLIRSFIVFEDNTKTDLKTGLKQVETVKKIAAYHQYYAVNKAVESAINASSLSGDRKGGVIWHTQGSGKSLTMVFFSGRLIAQMNNPTIVLITDRNDLDDQLFDTFANCNQLLRQKPVQAKSRDELKALLKVASGGIIFTTIQKFFPEDDKNEYDLLSERSNVIVIADEAHRTQYGFRAKLVDVRDGQGNLTGKKVAYGFAKYMRDALPNATYIGFTGTPIEGTDINTPAVFGDYIDIYDVARAVDDGATVKIYYESRLAKVNITEEGRHLIDELDDELEKGDLSESQKAKAKWTRLEAIVGHPERLKNLASDIVRHYESRVSVMNGKAMIVAMSRRIAVLLYDEIIKLRPHWESENLNEGCLKVVMTSSSSDKLEMDLEDPDGLVIPAKHRTNKKDRELLAQRMKNPQDPLQIVIVRDMWLTGFDVPCLHTLYIDKPMKGHTLMQAIARVNRVYLEKQGGLVVDYIGIGSALKEAMSFYANSGGKGSPAETQEKAVEMMHEKLEIVRQMFHQFDYSRFKSAEVSEKLNIILDAEEHILGLPDGKDRYIREVMVLERVFGLAIPHPEALMITEDVAFFQAVKARLLKFSIEEKDETQSYETAIRQIIHQAVESTEVIDIFDAAGLKKPDISLLSEEFLLEVKDMKHKNLALELLKKIINGEIHSRKRVNLVESKRLLEMLNGSINKYNNNLLTTAELIEELRKIAEEIRNSDELAKKLNLSEAEAAFFSAVADNESAVQILGDETLRSIAKELADSVRRNVTIDWSIRESARANIMRLVSRILRKYNYPPDQQQQAIDLVLKQTELLADQWVA